MPKLKTHKGAQKRFSVTGTGKVMRSKCGKSHLRSAKTKRVKRTYDSMMPVSKPDQARLKKILPNRG